MTGRMPDFYWTDEQCRLMMHEGERYLVDHLQMPTRMGLYRLIDYQELDDELIHGRRHHHASFRYELIAQESPLWHELVNPIKMETLL